MQSVELPFNVVETQQQTFEPEQPTVKQDSGIPTEYVTAAVAIIIIALIAVVSYWFMKKRNKGSPVLISD